LTTRAGSQAHQNDLFSAYPRRTNINDVGAQIGGYFSTGRELGQYRA
jgi:hypothetical protein